MRKESKRLKKKRLVLITKDKTLWKRCLQMTVNKLKSLINSTSREWRIWLNSYLNLRKKKRSRMSLKSNTKWRFKRWKHWKKIFKKWRRERKIWRRNGRMRVKSSRNSNKVFKKNLLLLRKQSMKKKRKFRSLRLTWRRLINLLRKS